jgi:hypothetical protein
MTFRRHPISVPIVPSNCTCLASLGSLRVGARDIAMRYHGRSDRFGELPVGDGHRPMY